jgi:hypothetical protein
LGFGFDLPTLIERGIDTLLGNVGVGLDLLPEPANAF